MDIEKRNRSFEDSQKVYRNLKDSYKKIMKENFSRSLGVSSVKPIKEEELEDVEDQSEDPVLDAPEGGDVPPAPEGDIGGEIEGDSPILDAPEGDDMPPAPEGDIPVDVNADQVEDGAPSPEKMATDQFVSSYITLPENAVGVEADNNGIVYADIVSETPGDLGKTYKIVIYPVTKNPEDESATGLDLHQVADIKEPIMDSPLDSASPAESEADAVEDIETSDVPHGPEGDLGGEPEGDMEGDLGGEPEIAPEDTDAVPEEDDEFPEEMKESIRDRKLRKKGYIGNTANDEDLEVIRENQRDPIHVGRKDWKKFMESRFSK